MQYHGRPCGQLIIPARWVLRLSELMLINGTFFAGYFPTVVWYAFLSSVGVNTPTGIFREANAVSGVSRYIFVLCLDFITSSPNQQFMKKLGLLDSEVSQLQTRLIVIIQYGQRSCH